MDNQNQIPAEPIGPPTTNTDLVPVSPAAPTQTVPVTQKRKRKWPWIIGGILLSIVVIIVVIIALLIIHFINDHTQKAGSLIKTNCYAFTLPITAPLINSSSQCYSNANTTSGTSINIYTADPGITINPDNLKAFADQEIKSDDEGSNAPNLKGFVTVSEGAVNFAGQPAFKIEKVYPPNGFYYTTYYIYDNTGFTIQNSVIHGFVIYFTYSSSNTQLPNQVVSSWTWENTR